MCLSSALLTITYFEVTKMSSTYLHLSRDLPDSTFRARLSSYFDLLEFPKRSEWRQRELNRVRASFEAYLEGLSLVDRRVAADYVNFNVAETSPANYWASVCYYLNKRGYSVPKAMHYASLRALQRRKDSSEKPSRKTSVDL